MIREIVKDEAFLAVESEEATLEDRQVARDLVETLRQHEKNCLGMAANMIGVRKRIISVFTSDGMVLTMLNPRITQKEQPYQASESCLSLEGKRSATRYWRIRVSYQDVRMRRHEQAFEGRDAQVIQHECDHLAGIVI